MNHASMLAAGIGPAPPEPDSGVLTTAKYSSPTALTMLFPFRQRTLSRFWVQNYRATAQYFCAVRNFFRQSSFLPLPAIASRALALPPHTRLSPDQKNNRIPPSKTTALQAAHPHKDSSSPQEKAGFPLPFPQKSLYLQKSTIPQGTRPP